MYKGALGRQWLIEGARRFGTELQEDQLGQLFRYRDLLREANRRHNLTGLAGEEEIIVKHFLDSLSGLLLFDPQPGEITLDIGPGAGFPSLPLRIVHSPFPLVLLEPHRHAADFLEAIVRELALEDVTIIRSRAEVAAHTALRGSFQWALARAVARLPALLELALPFLTPGGHFLAWKGDHVVSELEEAAQALVELGGEVVRVEPLSLPYWGLDRHLVLVCKNSPTPDRYPRREGVPARRPIHAPGKSSIIKRT